MSFISFSDHKLIEHTQQLAATERNIIAQVLDALAEIDRRRLYLDRGYGSLFAFCTEFLGYSGSSAQRRISSMRLLKKMPTIEKEEIADKLVTGALNLTHLSLVSQASKELSAPKVKELLNLVENTPTQECEKILAQEIGFELKRDRVRPVEVARIPHRGENILTAGADAEANVIVIDHVVAAHLFAAEAVPRTCGLFTARCGAGAGGQRPEADYRGEHADHGARPS